MNSESAIALIETLLDHKRLTKVQEIVFRNTWEGKTYSEMAQACKYDAGHLKDVGAELWRSLSHALNEKVTKNNIHRVIEKTRDRKIQPLNIQDITNTLESPITRHTDWNDAIDVSNFHGRSLELERIESWLVESAHCRLIAVLGMGGIGKTSLSVKLAQQVQQQFEFVIWRSLKDAPLLEELLQDLIKVLSQHQEVSLPTKPGSLISKLIQQLRNKRCLIILDNFEAALEDGQRSGSYRSEYEAYGELLQRIGEISHRSCLLLTSREKPAEVAALEGESLPVRSLFLTGLDLIAGQNILKAKGLSGTRIEAETLIQCYQGNPLALKIAATSILDLFAGNIAEFLQQGAIVFNGIRNLLDRQIRRLSAIEIQIMYWLAINREPVSATNLQADLIPKRSKADILEALESLKWRSLIEKAKPSDSNEAYFTQQPVVMEYITAQLIEQISQELLTQQIHRFNQYALIKARAKDYIRESQIRFILHPIANQLQQHFNCSSSVEQHCQAILKTIHTNYQGQSGYAGGNLLNLLRQFNFDLTGYDFSHLSVWQADLQGIQLHQVNFSHADLSQSRFSNALTNTVWVEVSPDGTRLVTSDANGSIRLWNLSDGQEILTLEGHSSWTWAVRFSPDGRSLASCSGDYTIRLWDTATGLCLQTLIGHTSSVWAVCFSSDGTLLASSSLDQTVKLWDISSGRCATTIEQTGGRSISFSPDGTKLAIVASDQTTIVLLNVHNQQILQTLSGHSQPIWSIAFSPDGTRLVSGSEDQTARLWQIEGGRCQHLFQMPGLGCVWTVAFSPDGQSVALGSDSGLITLWEVQTKQICQMLQGHTGHLWSIAFSPDSQHLASSAEDQTIRWWRVKTGQCLRTIHGYNGRIRAIALSPTAPLLASAVNQTISLWDTASGTCLTHLDRASGEIYSVAFSSDGTLLASGCNDGTLQLWNIKTQRCLQTFQAHIGRIFKVAFHPTQPYFISAGSDSTIRVWDVASSRCLQTLTNHTGWIFSATFSRSGRYLASGSDGEIKLWDVNTWQCVKTLQSHQGWVWALAFSPDDCTLASGGFDQVIRIWDVTTGKIVRSLNGHTKAVSDLFYTETGDQIISCGRDQTIRLWNLSTDDIRMLVGHQNWVWGICLTHSIADVSQAKRQTLISGSQDETIKLWNLGRATCSETWRSSRPYEGMKITGVVGLTDAQEKTLGLLGAIKSTSVEDSKSSKPGLSEILHDDQRGLFQASHSSHSPAPEWNSGLTVRSQLKLTKEAESTLFSPLHCTASPRIPFRGEAVQ
ncbi:WD40 domain-containing protein [Leptolyngbya sp. NIES-2104]|uniref:WD40 domain-containing protein n=1 Tax=Leptolyngbya sp. NIES-2104 TaxID=1552121 RepID=UPI0006EC4455|nr:NB-ARC domain-containing protein [Leptolyngbya sp. NIES-2104]GAP96963.1 high-affnity carbon uptake protein Hat/HatR [Leptolyngbya sp. NIES-2104]